MRDRIIGVAQFVRVKHDSRHMRYTVAQIALTLVGLITRTRLKHTGQIVDYSMAPTCTRDAGVLQSFFFKLPWGLQHNV